MITTFYNGYFYWYDLMDEVWKVEYMDDNWDYQREQCRTEDECRKFIDHYLNERY